MKEKEVHRLKRAMTPLHLKALEQTGLVGIWGYLKHPTPEPGCEDFFFVFDRSPSGMNFVSKPNRMGTSFASKLSDTFVVCPVV
eukprot:319308-Pelagomonas_calceolata.AAC.1